MELSIAAKAYMILKRESGEADKNKIRAVAENLGWSMSETGLDRAIDFLDKIHLAHWE